MRMGSKVIVVDFSKPNKPSAGCIGTVISSRGDNRESLEYLVMFDAGQFTPDGTPINPHSVYNFQVKHLLETSDT